MGHRRRVIFPAPPSPNKTAPAQAPVVDNTAAERRVLPVNIESGAQGSCGFVDALSLKQHDWDNTRGGRSEMPVPGQQNQVLSGIAPGELPVGNPAFGDDGVVPGRTQPPAEAVHHAAALDRHPQSANSLPRCPGTGARRVI